MKMFSDPVFILFLGFTIFAVIYAFILLYITFTDKNRHAHQK